MHFCFCSYNVGCESGYKYLLDYHKIDSKETSAKKLYHDAQKETGNRLGKDYISVFLLQELGDPTQVPLAQYLLANQYSIIGDPIGRAYNTAVVISTQHFESIKQVDIKVDGFTQKVAAATAIKKGSGKVCLFVSEYLPIISSFAESVLKYDNDQRQMNHEFQKKVLEQIRSIKADVILIGANMHNNPKVHRTTFDVMKSHKLKIVESVHPTNVYTVGKSHEERKIDFVFHKLNFWTWITKKIRVDSNIHWVMDVTSDESWKRNASHHTPLTGSVTIEDGYLGEGLNFANALIKQVGKVLTLRNVSIAISCIAGISLGFWMRSAHVAALA